MLQKYSCRLHVVLASSGTITPHPSAGLPGGGRVQVPAAGSGGGRQEAERAALQPHHRARRQAGAVPRDRQGAGQEEPRLAAGGGRFRHRRGLAVQGLAAQGGRLGSLLHCVQDLIVMVLCNGAVWPVLQLLKVVDCVLHTAAMSSLSLAVPCQCTGAAKLLHALEA